jgi:hypothetical protein
MRKPAYLTLHGVLFGLAGLVTTPVLYYGIGALLFGQRSTWSTGTGDGFVAFLTALYAAPLLGLLWAGAGVWIGVLRRRETTRWWQPLLGMCTFTGMWVAAGFAAQLMMN